MENNKNGKVWGIVAVVVVIVLIIIGLVYASNDKDAAVAPADQNSAQDADDASAANGASSNTNTNTAPAVKASATGITALTPAQGKAGSEVNISGYGFKTSNNVIKFAGFAINTVNSADGNHLTFKVPESLKFCNGANSCTTGVTVIEAGTYAVMVTNANGTTNVVNFTVTQSAESN